jgi:hypothetical protein
VLKQLPPWVKINVVMRIFITVVQKLSFFTEKKVHFRSPHGEVHGTGKNLEPFACMSQIEAIFLDDLFEYRNPVHYFIFYLISFSDFSISHLISP